MYGRPQRSKFFPFTTLFRSHVVSATHIVIIFHGNVSSNAGGLDRVACQHHSGRSREQQRRRAELDTPPTARSEEHTFEIQSQSKLECRLLLDIKYLYHKETL